MHQLSHDKCPAYSALNKQVENLATPDKAGSDVKVPGLEVSAKNIHSMIYHGLSSKSDARIPGLRTVVFIMQI